MTAAVNKWWSLLTGGLRSVHHAGIQYTSKNVKWSSSGSRLLNTSCRRSPPGDATFNTSNIHALDKSHVHLVQKNPCIYSLQLVFFKRISSSSTMNKVVGKKSKDHVEPTEAYSDKSRVHLYGTDEEDLGVMLKLEAQKLAKLQELKLIKTAGISSGYPIFRLMTGKQVHEESQRQKKEKKATKKLQIKSLKISNKITPHDLDIKIKHSHQWLGKGHDVRIVVKNVDIGNNRASGAILKQIHEGVEDIANIKEAKRTEKELTLELKAKTEGSDVKTNELQPLRQADLKQHAAQKGGPEPDIKNEG